MFSKQKVCGTWEQIRNVSQYINKRIILEKEYKQNETFIMIFQHLKFSGKFGNLLLKFLKMNTNLPKKMICYIRNIPETILMLGSGPKPAFLTRHFTGIFDFSFERTWHFFLPFQIFVMTVIPIQMNRDIFHSFGSKPVLKHF